MPAYDAPGHDPPAPIARVTPQHRESQEAREDVPMLIDTSADASLLPSAVVESLGIEGTGERYQLIAFDGTAIESETVRVDLVWLNRRFRGRFLVINDELGVLGRDVLNNLRLLLDGPNLQWDEWRPSKV